MATPAPTRRSISAQLKPLPPWGGRPQINAGEKGGQLFAGHRHTVGVAWSQATGCDDADDVALDVASGLPLLPAFACQETCVRARFKLARNFSTSAIVL